MFGSLPLRRAPEAPSGEAAGAGGVILDKKRENRTNPPPYSPLAGLIAPHEVVVSGCRSGGAFDPLGRRQLDVLQAERLVSLVDAVAGRWAFVTLTVNRSLFMFGPQQATLEGWKRLRHVMRRVFGEGCVYAAAIELQGKTGDGWPHWHVLVLLPQSESRTEAELTAVLRRRWVKAVDVVDPESGEVRRGRAVESVGFIKLVLARSSEATARYVAKYAMKPWPAVPPWMLESSRRFRKLSFSEGALVLAAELGLHVRHVGARRRPAPGPRPRARTLLERMSRSGSSCSVWTRTREGSRLRWVASLPVAADDVLEFVGGVDAPGVRVVRPGAVARQRVALSWSALSMLTDDRSRLGEFTERAERRVEANAAVLLNAWDDYQQRRALEEADGC